MKRLLILSTLFMGGCASADEYIKYADTQVLIVKEHAAVEIAKANADAEKYKAIAAIAAGGDVTAKVAGVMALSAPSGQAINGMRTPILEKPKSASDTILQWTGIILPSIVSAYGINANKAISIAGSNNARDVSISTNESFVRMGGQIQAPQPNINVTSSNGVGIGGGDGSYTYNTASTNQETTTTSTDNHSLNNSNNPITTYPVAP